MSPDPPSPRPPTPDKAPPEISERDEVTPGIVPSNAGPIDEAVPEVPHHLTKEDYDDLRAQVKGAIAYNRVHNPAATKQSVFDFFGVKRRNGYKMLQESPARRMLDEHKKERRGRRVKILKEDVRCMEAILKTEKVKSQGGSWKGTMG